MKRKLKGEQMGKKQRCLIERCAINMEMGELHTQSMETEQHKAETIA